MRLFNLTLLFTASIAIAHPHPTKLSPGLRVNTTSAVLSGFVKPSVPDVRQFLGVPFARSPTGNRRWLPPAKLISNDEVLANDIGPACPQLIVEQSIAFNSSVYSSNGGNQTEFFPLHNFSEHCLTLNIWTPRQIGQDVPVIVWFFGVSIIIVFLLEKGAHERVGRLHARRNQFPILQSRKLGSTNTRAHCRHCKLQVEHIWLS